jgi:hypothetical protein
LIPLLKEWNKADEYFGEGKYIRIHPAWYSFVKYCESLKFGEIEKLKIQDGLPVMAEEVKKKVAFTE